MKLQIDPEFNSLLRPLTRDEYRALEQSILEDGCEDSLKVWNGIIVDGHHRYEICERHGIPFTIVDKAFEDREAAKLWIVATQTGRRNLNTYEYAVLILRSRGKELREEAKGRQLSGLKQYKADTVCPTLDKRIEPVDTKKELAKSAGISHGTMAKVMKIEEEATLTQKERLMAGEDSINKVYREIREGERRQVHVLPSPELPAGKYRTIVVDPPWPMKKILREVRPNQRQLDYTTMSIEEIGEFGIPGISAIM